MGKILGRRAGAVISCVRHPLGAIRRVTCLDCGFLHLDGNEVCKASRIELGCRETAGGPALEKIQCFSKLWLEYDLIYFGFCAEGKFNELEKHRHDCEGFFAYRPGWSPSGHQDLLLKDQSKKEQRRLVLVSSLVATIFTLLSLLLAKYLGLTLP